MIDPSEVSAKVDAIFSRYNYAVPTELVPLIKLSCDLDNEFDIVTELEEFEGLSSFTDVVNLVCKKLNAKAAA